MLFILAPPYFHIYVFNMYFVASFCFFSFFSRELEHAGEEESVILEGDIGGGLVLRRQIYVPKNAANVIQIDSSIIARSVGAGSGGFSRLYLKLSLLYPHSNCIISPL